MSNEEYLEEMFHIAHKCGVLTEFHEKITTTQSQGCEPLFTVIPKVFSQFKKQGLIVEED